MDTSVGTPPDTLKPEASKPCTDTHHKLQSPAIKPKDQGLNPQPQALYHGIQHLEEYLQSEHPDWLPFPKEDTWPEAVDVGVP